MYMYYQKKCSKTYLGFFGRTNKGARSRVGSSPWQRGTGAFHRKIPCAERVHVALLWPISRKPWSQLKRKVLPNLVPVRLCTVPLTGLFGGLQYAAMDIK